MEEEIRDVVGGGSGGHGLGLDIAKNAVKNFYFTTGQLSTIKPEKKKRTTDRFKHIANFVCMKIYTKYDNQICVNSKSKQ